MTKSQQQVLEEVIDRLYLIFEEYPSSNAWCTFCWNPKEINSINVTNVRNISSGMAEKLTHECADHFNSVDVYKHFIPRILDALAPPNSIEYLYPLHLFETLQAHNFDSWLCEERDTVLEYLEAVTPLLSFFDEEDKLEWEQGCDALRNGEKLDTLNNEV